LISGIIQIAWDIITGIFKIGADLLSGNWGQMWADIQGMADSVKQTVIGIVKGLWDDLKGLWNAGTTMIHDVWSTVWNGLAGIAASAWDGVKGTIRNGINGAIDLINDLIRQADKVPGVSIPQIGHVNFATGGTMLKSGLAMVGENGPELLALPAGAHVYNNTQTQQIAAQSSHSGRGVTNNFYGVYDPTAIQQAVGIGWKREMLLHGW
jgi:phage-related protein